MRVETLSRHSAVIDRSRKPVYGGLNVSQHCDEDDNHCNHDRCLKTLVAVADKAPIDLAKRDFRDAAEIRNT